MSKPIPHSAEAFTEAPDGTWGVLYAHSADQEALGGYRTFASASTRAEQVVASQPGVRYVLVKRARQGDVVANGYLRRTRATLEYLSGGRPVSQLYRQDWQEVNAFDV